HVFENCQLPDECWKVEKVKACIRSFNATPYITAGWICFPSEITVEDISI
ncbi:hypothetical protein CEXT_666091, partial [Caerostris extrusa]